MESQSLATAQRCSLPEAAGPTRGRRSVFIPFVVTASLLLLLATFACLPDTPHGSPLPQAHTRAFLPWRLARRATLSSPCSTHTTVLRAGAAASVDGSSLASLLAFNIDSNASLPVQIEYVQFTLAGTARAAVGVSVLRGGARDVQSVLLGASPNGWREIFSAADLDLSASGELVVPLPDAVGRLEPGGRLGVAISATASATGSGVLLCNQLSAAPLPPTAPLTANARGAGALSVSTAVGAFGTAGAANRSVQVPGATTLNPAGYIGFILYRTHCAPSTSTSVRALAAPCACAAPHRRERRD